MKHPKIARSILYIIVTASMMYCYSAVLALPFTVVEATILAGFGWPLGRGLYSFLKSPRQFLSALFQYTKRVLAQIGIVLVKIYGFLLVCFFRFGKLFLWLLLAVVYGVSPIDLIPDILIGPGQVDDILVFFVSLWAGLSVGKSAVRESINETVRNLNDATKITIKFP